MNNNNQLQIRTEILLYISFPGHQTKDVICSFSPLPSFPLLSFIYPSSVFSFLPSPSLFFSSSFLLLFPPPPPFLFPSLSLLFSLPLLCCLVITVSDNMHFLQPLPGPRGDTHRSWQMLTHIWVATDAGSHLSCLFTLGVGQQYPGPSPPLSPCQVCFVTSTWFRHVSLFCQVPAPLSLSTSLGRNS